MAEKHDALLMTLHIYCEQLSLSLSHKTYPGEVEQKFVGALFASQF